MTHYTSMKYITIRFEGNECIFWYTFFFAMGLCVGTYLLSLQDIPTDPYINSVDWSH